MKVRIQLASLMDLDDLLALLVKFREHLQIQVYSQDDLRSALQILLIDPMCDLVLVTSTTGFGLAYAQIRYFYSLWSFGLEAKLENLFVDSKVRRKGLGAKLLAFSIKRARDRHCRLIALNTNERNVAARNFYAKQGFSSQPSRWQGGQQLWLEKSL